MGNKKGKEAKKNKKYMRKKVKIEKELRKN